MEAKVTFEDFINSTGKDVIDIAYHLLDSIPRSTLSELYEEMKEEGFKNYVCGMYFDQIPSKNPGNNNPLSPQQSNVGGNNNNPRSPRQSNVGGNKNNPLSPRQSNVGGNNNNPYDLLSKFIFKKPEPTVDDVIRLIEQYQLRDLKAYTSDGNPPLVAPILNGREDLVELFIKRNADVNQPTKGGFSMLCISLQSHECIRSRMFKLLLSKGANPEATAMYLEDKPITIDHPSLSHNLSETMKYWLQRAKKSENLPTQNQV